MSDYPGTTPARRPMLPSVPGPSAAKAAAPQENIGKPLAGVEVFSRGVPAPIGHIAEAISNVTMAAGTVQKRGYNSFHRYHYATMGDITHALAPLIGKQGLMILQTEVERTMIEGNRIAVTYEFTIAHKSGQKLDEKIRFTSTSLARDSKGGWDDKAINKCHTNARKYVLVGLFHVAAGDFDDEDATDPGKITDDANQREERRSVPGPNSEKTETAAPAPTENLKKITPEAKERASEQASKEGIPHKIILGQGSGADQWASAYLRNINKARSKLEIAAWDKANEGSLQAIYDGFPGVYDMIAAAVERRLASFESKSPEPAMTMPSDPQEAMNWIAEQLQTFNTYEKGETFWNTQVAPREKDFDQVDWGMLLEEWQRFETRFPQEPDAA
jgi:hypothetical protein